MDLHLIVDAAEELDVPVAQSPHAVAGPVEPRRRVVGERIGEEALLRLLRLGEIAASDAVAADAQLARNADRQKPHIAVDDVGAARRAAGARSARSDRCGAAVPTSNVQLPTVVSVGP